MNNATTYAPTKHGDHPEGWVETFGGELIPGQEFRRTTSVKDERGVHHVGYAASARVLTYLGDAKASDGTWVFGPASVWVKSPR